jgi:hypothetical protein
MILIRRSAHSIVTAFVVLFLAIASSQSVTAQVVPQTRFGSLFNPAHMPDGVSTTADFLLALQQTANLGGPISFMHDWSAGEAGLTYLGLMVPAARHHGLKVFLQLAPTSMGQPMPPAGVPASFSNPQARARYLADVERLASFIPDYLNLCPEVDLTFALAPGEAAAFASLYKEAYAVVKRVSPHTQVGVSYHFDMFFTFQEFAIPAYLGAQDYIGFTSYPAWLVYDGFLPTVGALPDFYYDRVRTVFPTQPIVFTEIGWPSEGGGTPQDQTDFVSALPRLMRTVRPALLIWTMLTDVHKFQLALLTDEQRRFFESINVDPAVLFARFNSMGLVDWDGLEKAAYLAARALAF